MKKLLLCSLFISMFAQSSEIESFSIGQAILNSDAEFVEAYLKDNKLSQEELNTLMSLAQLTVEERKNGCKLCTKRANHAWAPLAARAFSAVSFLVAAKSYLFYKTTAGSAEIASGIEKIISFAPEDSNFTKSDKGAAVFLCKIIKDHLWKKASLLHLQTFLLTVGGIGLLVAGNFLVTQQENQAEKLYHDAVKIEAFLRMHMLK
jgi:hypothetical protein